MNDIDATRLRDDYLARLDEAMRGLPHGVAGEIRQGIVEELEGLDADATAERIERLGDPVGIAREAQDEVPVPPVALAASVTAAAAPRPPATSTRGSAIAAALTLGFGGIVVPVLGWVVGVVLVCLSPLWKAWEKAVAILVPLVFVTLSAVITASMSFASGEATGGSMSGTGVPPVEPNPLLPAWYDLFWLSGLALAVLLVPASGLWLL